MTRKIIWIRWRDAALHLQDLRAADVESYQPCTIVETCGLFVNEKDGAIILAVDWMEQQQKYRSIVSIPKVNIVKKRVFRVEDKN